MGSYLGVLGREVTLLDLVLEDSFGLCAEGPGRGRVGGGETSEEAAGVGKTEEN